MQDYVTRLVVIWSLVSVFWRATEEAIVKATGRHRSVMVLYGYVAVLVMMTVGKHLAKFIISRSRSRNFKLIVELLYVSTSAVASVMLWTGNDLVRQLLIISWQNRLV